MITFKSRLRRIQTFLKSLFFDPWRLGVPIVSIKPRHWIVSRLAPTSVIPDLGLGFNADFSKSTIDRFDLSSHGYNLARQHLPGLQLIFQQSDGRVQVHGAAIAAVAGTETFCERAENVSRSLIGDRSNALTDALERYPAEIITAVEALNRLPPRSARSDSNTFTRQYKLSAVHLRIDT